MPKKRPPTTKATIEEYRKKFDKLDIKRKKHNSQAIERRRQDVWEMMCQEIPQTEMATLLGVARSTVTLDVKFWRERVADRVRRMKENPNYANIELGLTVKKLDALTAAAFQEYSLARSGGEKAKFLDIATKTLSTKTRILQDTGYLPKAGIDIRTRIETVPTFADRFGESHALTALDDATKRHKLLGLAEKIIRLSQDDEIIDVESSPLASYIDESKSLETRDEPPK
jgi:hypothetical protein